MCTYDRSILTQLRPVELFAIPSTLQGGLYARRPELWDCVKCCRVLLVPTSTFSAYYKNLVIGYHLGAMTVCDVIALEFVI